MKVPQLAPYIGKEEYQAIKKCFAANWITEGPLAKKFTEELLKLLGARYGVFAPNGTLALYLGLRAIDIQPGDEVIVPDITFIASATAVEMCGATPLFVDVNDRNFQIDLKTAERLITPKTRAIMPVHLYGTTADMQAITKFAQKHKLKIIEDAAQAIGVTAQGKHAGTFGEVGCFSFFADKTITTGEGGFVVTNNKKIYENLLYLRNQGRIDRGSFIHPRLGYNFRMTDIAAAIGLVQLSKLNEIKKRKRDIFALYKTHLQSVPEIHFFQPVDEKVWIPFRVPILTERAHELMQYLKEHDIEPRTYFYPLHKQPAFSYLKKKYQDKDFPNSIKAYEQGICLPVFPSIKNTQVLYVCKIIKQFFNEK